MRFKNKIVADGGLQIPASANAGTPAVGSIPMAVDAAGNVKWDPLVQIGALDAFGDSHIAEYGPSSPDYGIVQILASRLQPALLRTAALSGAAHAGHNQGNGRLGDGGWAHVANEFDRQEQSGAKYNSTITQTQASGVSSYTVAALSTPVAPSEWLVIGQGANTEVLQVAAGWLGTSPITFATPTTKAHTTGDPIYHACRNEGFMAKSGLVVDGASGANDIGWLGPGAPPLTLSSTWQSGTFGTTNGASRGLSPFMHAQRFSIANMRCSVIYNDTHTSIVYGANWNNQPVTSTASYPTIYTLGGGNNGNYHYTTVAGSTLSFSTEPNFPGGTVAIFLVCGAAGQGAIWDYSVSGATTVAMTAHAAGTVYDHRNVNMVTMNDAVGLPSGQLTGTCIRITGLNAGVNTITLKATTLNSTASFLGWGVEAPVPCPIVIPIGPRLLNSNTGSGYATRTFAGTGATVLAGKGAGAGEVTFVGATLALGTAGTVAPNAAGINDTITLDKGNIALEETRRIIGYTGSPATACQVDANFVNAHTNAPVVIGEQHADFVGGGYYNVADTQGAISVPGLAGALHSVANEFDANVIAIDMDPIINAPGKGTAVNPLNYFIDGVHYNDQGSTVVAAGLDQQLLIQPWTIPQFSSATIPNKRTYLAVYGDVGATPTASSVVPIFANGWTNAFPTNASYPRLSLYKDVRSREVEIVGAVTGGAQGTAILQLPVGYQPGFTLTLPNYTLNEDGTYGTATVTINNQGLVSCTAGYPGATGILVITGSFMAAA